MSDTPEVVALLREVRDLLSIMAEPMLRDHERAQRTRLREIAGKSDKKRDAIRLMGQDMTRQEIIKASSIDPSDMTRLMKTLRAEGLIEPEDERPKLKIRSVSSVFDEE